MRILALFLAVIAGPVWSHPHVFVDTGIEVIIDDEGRLSGVRVTWDYDEFYSLLITEDRGLDTDGDGQLTPEEVADLTGFDMNWSPGFNGDLEVLLDDAPLALSGPEEATAEFTDGRIITTHLRGVTARPVLGARLLSVKAYDETYYTEYKLALPVFTSGPAVCMIERIEPDVDGQLAQMQSLLLQMDANADLEENDIPLIGGEFATEIRVSCPAS